MSATGSVNFIGLLLLGHPFSPPQRRTSDGCSHSITLTTPFVMDHSPLQRAPARCLPTTDSQRPTTVYYQDDFATPGISPRNASPRKHRRQSPNLRRNARGRPQIWQRLCLRDENLGFLASLTRFAVVAKNQLLALKLLAQNLQFTRFLCPERHSHVLQQRPGLIVVARRGHNRHVHAFLLVHFLVGNLRENQLIVQADGVIPA